MTEEKRNKLIAAVTVNVILLIVILAVVLVYQLIEISVKNNRKKQYAQEIQSYYEELEKAENSLDYYQSDEYLKQLAFKYGFDFPD